MAMVVANGVRLSVTEIPSRRRKMPSGDQIPNVFIHGLAASSAFWYGAGAQVFSVLGPSLLYDLRGHGRSEAPDAGYAVPDMVDDLIGLLDHFGYARVNLVSHSFGGMIALLAAVRHPDRVASLTLADVRVRPLQTKIAIKAAKLPTGLKRKLESVGIDPKTVGGTDDGINYLSAVARIQVAAGDQANDILTAIYKHKTLFKSANNARKWIRLSENPKIVADLQDHSSFRAADLRRLSLPMLIMVGAKSPTVNSARALHQICPHARYHEVPDLGHFFPVSSPRNFVRPTLRFLRASNRGDARLLKAPTDVSR